jgi:hypothetical protein
MSNRPCSTPSHTNQLAKTHAEGDVSAGKIFAKYSPFVCRGAFTTDAGTITTSGFSEARSFFLAKFKDGLTTRCPTASSSVILKCAFVGRSLRRAEMTRIFREATRLYLHEIFESFWHVQCPKKRGLERQCKSVANVLQALIGYQISYNTR